MNINNTVKFGVGVSLIAILSSVITMIATNNPDKAPLPKLATVSKVFCIGVRTGKFMVESEAFKVSFSCKKDAMSDLTINQKRNLVLSDLYSTTPLVEADSSQNMFVGYSVLSVRPVGVPGQLPQNRWLELAPKPQ